ncbi:MAG: PEGA domain-containing protein [Myxococcales bacterium]|nr:PEGA domain-containing protein [Myxococcales bacterium]
MIASAAGPVHAQPDADARAQAGAAFKRAVAAEGRRDWPTALAEYETAYQLSPHPDVLYNIASVHERTGALRAAATYYQRYLDGSPSAADRAKVVGKLAELRARPATLTITTRPAGAAVLLDGKPAGAAPLAVRVDGGAHQLVAEAAGARASRAITIEFGEPQAVDLTVAAGRGTLVVASNAPGATVTIDGRPVGTTPWSGAVEAGHHVVVIAAPGYTTTERAIEVPADGSAQIQGALGRPVGWVEPTPPTRTSVRAVFDSGTYLEHGFVVGIAAGYRTATQRLEATTGMVFGSPGFGWAFRGRAFLLTGPVRPYVVAGVNYGFAGGSSALAGGGVLIATGRAGAVSMELFAESGYGAGSDADGGFRFVPIIAGVSFGRSQP